MKNRKSNISFGIYYHDLRGLLEESGYFNSGITIRWVSEEGEGRTYTVMIHHREIDLLSSSEKEALMQALSQAEFDDQSCRFIPDRSGQESGGKEYGLRERYGHSYET